MARQRAKLANGNIPYYECHAQFMNGGLPGGRNMLFSFLWDQVLSCQELELFQEFIFFPGISQN